MNFRTRLSALPIILVGFLLAGCGGGTQNSNSVGRDDTTTQANAAKTNIEELSLMVRVPYEVEDVVWKEYPVNKKVVAVLRFSPADANALAAEAANQGTQNVSVAVESWFPSELIAQADMSGDNTLKGVAYPATKFLQAPYNAGTVTRIQDGDYFVLELSAR